MMSYEPAAARAGVSNPTVSAFSIKEEIITFVENSVGSLFCPEGNLSQVIRGGVIVHE